MKYFFLLIALITFNASTFAQDRQLKAYLDNKQFYAPGTGNYIEFYLQFDGPSINYLGLENGLIGEVAIIMSIKKGDSIITGDAYRLSSPLMKDSIVEDFYDVKRFVLAPGKYNFSISLQDMNSENEPLNASQDIYIEEMGDAISISDILIAEVATKGDPESNFYKSGFNIIPRLSTFYPEQLNSLPAYFEIYNSMVLEDTVFGIKQSIINASTGAEIEEFTVFTRHYTTSVVPIMKNVDISNLMSGKYVLTYTLLNKNMLELSTQSYEFERSKDITMDLLTEDLVLDPSFQESIPSDSIGYYLESLIPISKANEIRNIIKVSKAKDETKARKYIQQFWMQTSSSNPYEAWMRYKQQVLFVEKVYANNFQEGYETDRGRVYLQYGSPSNMTEKLNSPSEYPYEIWRYDKIGVFSNKRFIFYNPDLVNNAYRLLHSDMIGELKNPSWPQMLNRRNTNNGNAQNPNGAVQDHWGGQSNDVYDQF